jgi:hypothetical protein
MPAVSSDEHTMARSQVSMGSRTWRTSSSASAGRPSHSASSAAHNAAERPQSPLPSSPVTSLSRLRRSVAAVMSPRTMSISPRLKCMIQ